MDTINLQSKARAGDVQAFAELVSQSYPALCRHAAYLVRDDAVAEDIVQESLIKAHAHIHKYDPSRNFSTWAYKIVTNSALDYLRKKKDVSLEAFDELPDSEDNVLLDQEDKILREQQIEQLKAALARLPDHYKLVIDLYYWEDKSYEDIADILQKPVGTIKTWLFRAKKQLKEECNG